MQDIRASIGGDQVDEELAHGADDAPLSLRCVPWRHTKTVHFIRHGEGYHNVALENGKDWASDEFFDAHLTPRGWQQAEALGRHIAAHRDRIRPEVVIVSPLVRALETAAGAFGGPEWHPKDAAEPLMREQDAEQGRVAPHAAVSSAGCPPFVAWEGCRENLGVNPCNRRRPAELYAQRFPAVDFSLVAPGEDSQWQAGVRESGPEVRARGLAFARWLLARPEQELAVVSHCTFLFFLMHSLAGRDCSERVQGELLRMFENAEMRTLVLSDGCGEGNLDPLWFPGGRGSEQANT